ncbi:amidase [Microvirga aerilata]|uniref:Indoleacetamide hydrolase n=1 Tax=Microvirga aerilata TaxID=670292 RepID=A0A937CZD2_9HYPH|nr:amidase [Microvirga aerilata]MBL0406529.1 amidase [Microvirga aerilata]
MVVLEQDPLGQGGLSGFARRFRAGEITSEQATRAYLSRIEALDPRLGAFQHVAAEQALETARAIDALYSAGTDLGLLMGVPIAVKDLFVVEGMPTTAGTKMSIDDIAGPEGPLVKSLRQAGCVILGKTRTVEFALGITGVSSAQGTPINPWDAQTPRLPGGSSSGSGVAVAAGLCAFAVGSDTGGSVRVPAAFNGIFGFKTTPGFFSTDGAFPLAPHLDTPGLLTRSARDAAIAVAALTGEPEARPLPVEALRLGIPQEYFFDNLDPVVEAQIRGAMEALSAAGCRLRPVSVPEASERERYFPAVLPACLIATLGRDRFLAGRDQMDPIVAKRATSGLDVTAADYLALEAKRAKSRQSVSEKFSGFDGWVTPTTATPPPSVADLDDEQKALDLALGMTRNTQPANYFACPAVSIPLPQKPGNLPIGLQIICPEGADVQALSIALAIEEMLGTPEAPNLADFLS